MSFAPLHAAGADPETIGMLVDISIVLGMCVVFGLAMQRIGQSVLVGYLLAGLLLGGPGSLGLVDDIESFSFMGEVGIGLLLFTVALDLPLERVRRFGRMAIVAGGVQVILTCALAAGVAMAFGLGISSALVVGMAIALSSTAVVIRVLADRSETDSVHGLVSTGMLIAQDVMVVLVLLLIPLLPGADAGGGGDSGSWGQELLLAVSSLALLVTAVFAVERIAMRRLFRGARFTAARELLAVGSLTVSLGAIGACWALDLSPALGGFVAGIVMADANYASQVRSEIAPIRMGLVAVFFAYVGMLADAAWMAQNALLIVGAVLALVGGKALLTWIACRVARVPSTACLMTAAALAQLGEFSFAVLTTGDAAGLISPETFRLLVSVSLVTLLITPGLIAGTSSVLQRRSLAAGLGVHVDSLQLEQAVSGHAIVIGVGPAGRCVADALSRSQVPVTVIELNPRAETGAADDDLPPGTRVVFGDASRPEILARANIASARIIVVTIPDPVAIRTIVAQCRQLSPSVPVIARGRYNRYVSDIAAAGADEVVDEENVTGRELAEVALQRLVRAGEAERRRGERRGTAPWQP